MSRAAGRRVFDLLESAVAPWTPRQPRLALAAAAALGSLRNRTSRRWPGPEEVRALFPALGRPAAVRVAARIGALEARNRALVACIRRAGLDPIRPLVRSPSGRFSALRPPLIFGTFHVGALHALSPVLERLPGRVLVLRQGILDLPRPPVEIASTEGDDQRRARVFHRALSCLEDGGFVVTALDVVPGPGLHAPCLGRRVPLARGPFAMARLTGAPLVPLVTRWRGGRVEAMVGEVLEAHAEEALALSAAAWLERYLLENPAELGLGLLRSLLAAGPVSPANDGR